MRRVRAPGAQVLCRKVLNLPTATVTGTVIPSAGLIGAIWGMERMIPLQDFSQVRTVEATGEQSRVFSSRNILPAV